MTCPLPAPNPMLRYFSSSAVRLAAFSALLTVSGGATEPQAPPAIIRTGNDISLVIENSELGRAYFVQCSSDQQIWNYLMWYDRGASNPISANCSLSGGTRLFFRLQYSDDPSEDFDNDGLSNGDEVRLRGTLPFNPDTDGDGMPDGWEVQYNLNPTANDAAADADGDTLSNLQEYLLGTKPNGPGSTDSDGDGLADGLDTNPAHFDMPIISVMEYSREATLQDWREPAYASRHSWTASTYRQKLGYGFNGSGGIRPLWVNPTIPDVGTMNPNFAIGDFLNENIVANPNATPPRPAAPPLSWGTARSVGTTLRSWLRQSYNWEQPYRIHRVSAREVRYFLESSREMPLEMKVRAKVTKYTRFGALDADWSAGSLVESGITITLQKGDKLSNEIIFQPTSYSAITPSITNDANPRTCGDTFFKVEIVPFPYPSTFDDSDGDGLPNDIEDSLGTLKGTADSDGDTRPDFFDFISSIPGSLAPLPGPRSQPSSPGEAEPPFIEFIWRDGHVCPTSEFSARNADASIAVYGAHWELGSKQQNINPAPTDSTLAILNFWITAPAHLLLFPSPAYPPATLYDEIMDPAIQLRSFISQQIYSYSTPSLSAQGGDAREAMMRLRRTVATSAAVSRQFLLIDRQKTDTTASTWTYNSITPKTYTIAANQLTSPAVTLTTNDLKLPNAITPAADKTSLHEVFLLPIEVVDKDKYPVSKLKIGKMSEPGVLSGTGASTTLDIDKDSDRFHVRVKGGAALGALSVKVSTTDNLDIAYNDDATRIDLVADGADAISKSMLLVADNGDDDYSVDSIADDVTGDRTHKIHLGGNFTVKSITAGGIEYQLDAKTPVKAKKKVIFEAVIVRKTPGGTVPITEFSLIPYLKTARERFAQAEVYLDWTITTVDPPSTGVDLEDGLDFFATDFSPETQNPLNGLATASEDDMQVFFVNYLYPILGTTTYGHAYPDSATPGKKYVNSVIINTFELGSPDERYTIAHEIGHVLAGVEHWGGDKFPPPLTEEQKRNLMAAGEPRNTGKGIGGGKRLVLVPQVNAVQRHRLTQAP